MIGRVGVGVLVAATLAGCGDARRDPSPEAVARQWSAALDRDDNTAAGALFAPFATIVQNGELTLRNRDEAIRWNVELPCGGKILSVRRRSATEVLVVFRLTERPLHVCDAPGAKAAAIFRVRGGKIVLWHQVPVPRPPQTIRATRRYFSSGSSL